MIITAEEIVPSEAIVRTADRTVIPGFVVDAVVEVPFGSYPHECHGRYEADFEHFDAYTDMVSRDGVGRACRPTSRRPSTGRAASAPSSTWSGASRLLEQRRRARELVAA